MGNAKSKKVQKEPDNFFDREKERHAKREEKRKLNVKPKRPAAKEPAIPTLLAGPPVRPVSAPTPLPPPVQTSSYNDMALARMRDQLRTDADAFLMNNILLSVQFFENYERETEQIKNNPISERENVINDAMIRQNKHVFFADRLQECVHEHVQYQATRGQTEPLSAPRLYVIYDNVEASEPGDTSDYSAVLDAPFYKLRIEDCKEAGYVKLKKLEVLESTLHRESEINNVNENNNNSDDSLYADSEKESIDSDDYSFPSKGEKLFPQLATKIHTSNNNDYLLGDSNLNCTESVGRRYSGPIKQVSLQVARNNISNINRIRSKTVQVIEENESDHCTIIKDAKENLEKVKARKSILKNSKRVSGSLPDLRRKSLKADQKLYNHDLAEDTESSGYRSSSSCRLNDFSETESDYGYATITEATTPRKIELRTQSRHVPSTSVLSDESWIPVDVRSVDNWSEDEEEIDEAASRMSLSRNLYERYFYLGSVRFMQNFVDNFIVSLGSGLGLPEDSITSAMTQGASLYCDTMRNGSKVGCEIYPALIAAWPNKADPWIIRERKLIQNPRTNFTYQWPDEYMVRKAVGLGCLLVPVGFRPKRGLNGEQPFQWKIVFPAAERYLESCLAHAHIRTYLFTLALQKTFMENESSKIGIDASHIKNHLFWQCEDNYARWPEDRLGETLRLFLKKLYTHFALARSPNYFVDGCNEFKSIPTPLLLKLQSKLKKIREAPVMHILHAIDKLKYTKKDFYPKFNCHKLYEILTCKNPLRILNPNLPISIKTFEESSNNNEHDSDSDDNSQQDKAKTYDKNYQWTIIARQKYEEGRRQSQLASKKQKSVKQQRKEINPNIILPTKLEAERRRLVLEFFIPHFIAMARSSEKFMAIRQAIIYLEQAQRLCVLLMEEPGGDANGHEYLDIIRDKLADCQRKLVKQRGINLPLRKEHNSDRLVHNIPRQRPKVEHIVNQDSPTENHGIQAFSFVDVHGESLMNHMVFTDNIDEESKL